MVDYWGVSESLTDALAIFAPSDVKGAMTPKSDELPRLQARHAVATGFFRRVADRDDLDACVSVLEPADVRAKFDDAFRKFSESLDMLLPDPKALPYQSDARWLGKIRAVAAAKFRDGKIDISDCGAKVRRLIEDAVSADGIQILVKQISLFSPEFEDKLKALKSVEARASEMEHAIRDEIHVRLDDNPVFFTSLRERLQKVIDDRRAMRIDAAEQLRLFEELRKELRGHAQAAEAVGLSEAGFAMYGLLLGGAALKAADPSGPLGMLDGAKKELAALLEEQLGPQVEIVDWWMKDDVQKEMRRRIKRQLRAAGYNEDRIDPLAEGIVDLLKRRRSRR